MERLSVQYSSQGYYIGNGIISRDYEIADYLNISLAEYERILLDNGATPHYYMNVMNEYYFKEREDVIRTLVSLEPYIIMVELTK